jgi:hypothetical protein
MSRFSPGDVEVPQEEADEVLRLAAEKIHQYGMETIAIMTLETLKPMVFIGGELSRVVIAPFLPALGPDYNLLAEKLLLVFEDRKNIEKLIQMLEAMASGEYEAPKEKTKSFSDLLKQEKKEIENTEQKKDASDDAEKKGWRRWLPF